MQMQKMGTGDGREILPETSTETYGADRKAFSGPLNKRGTRKSARFNIPDDVGSNSGSTRSRNNEDYVEITLDVGDDSVAVHSVKTAGGGDVEDPELTLLAKGLEKRGRLGTSAVQNASSRIRQVSEELRKLTSFSWRPLGGRYDRTKSGAVPALQGLKFISKANSAAARAALENRFDKLTQKTNGLLPRASFGECIGMNEDSKEFAGELFDALSRRRNIQGDLINKEQLKDFWDQISDQSFDTRLQTFFDMVDKDADGRISEEEVKEIISLSASANKLSNIQEQADEYAALIMEELDPDNLGYIMIESLETLLLQAPAQSVRGDSKALSMMLSTNLRNENYRNPIERGYNSMKYFIQDNWQRIWVLAVWIGICAGLFTYKYIQYKNRAAYDVMGACVSIAKGGAETLKFNMALILLPVCRNTVTWLRNKTKLGVVVPFDDNLNFHKVIAFGITIGVGLHAISHLACDFPRLLAATEEEYEPMEQYFGEQPTSYWWFVKGVEGWTGITMVVLMAIAFTLATPRLRRGRLNLPKPLKKLEEPLKKLTGFNAFWYTHHLFIIVYGILIVHGIKLYLTKEWYKKTTWMYLAVPILLYACERLTRALRSTVKPVSRLKVVVYPGDVLTLQMSKPDGFKYKSGQYMFVNCKAVSPFEWHPFSITSAPGDDYLSVHIRTLGDWTTQLKNVFSKACQPPADGKSGLLRADNQGNNLDLPTVLIDGPYGAPAQDYKKYDVVLLVGLGIGATPMISILKDIVNNMKTEEAALESGINNSVSPPSPLSKKSTFKTTRAYFYWVTKEQGSFDWFKGVMNEVAETDHDNVIEMHNHCTSVYEEGDARSALITMIQSLNHAKNGVDVVSGTRVKSHFAKPNWRSVYKRISITHSGQRVGVFYCGKPEAVPELKQLASDFSHKTPTKFDFHKENF